MPGTGIAGGRRRGGGIPVPPGVEAHPRLVRHAEEATMEQERMPRCGAFRLPDGSCCWRVWAPQARSVELVLLDGGQRRWHPMTAEPHGYFSHIEAGISEG